LPWAITESVTVTTGSLGAYHPDSFYPSIAVNEFDEGVIDFTDSSATEYAGAYAVLGETLNGITTFGELLLLVEGLDEFTFSVTDVARWGDYSATVVDETAFEMIGASRSTDHESIRFRHALLCRISTWARVPGYRRAPHRHPLIDDG